MAAITIQKLIKRTSCIQNRMAIEAVGLASQGANAFQHLQEDLIQILSETASGVNKILIDRKKTAADLPVRTRRAYQWITFLSNPDNLNEHLDALQRVNLYLPHYKSQVSNKKIDFAFYHLGSLYKITENSSGKNITVQESFTQAPDKILTAILETAFLKQPNPSRHIIRDYTFTPEYQAARTRLEYLHVPPGSYAQGLAHQLDLSFKRVNQQYFHDNLSRPHLIWSSRLTFRKFGHYQWDIDTVMISQTLDNHHVPEFVVDYVMYHELLHKKLGIRKMNGRRFSHTKNFRDEEQKFIKFEQAIKYLNRISRKKS
ncbi:MAG: hypothetical protein ACC633_00630 [Anaerolineales bacterium]